MLTVAQGLNADMGKEPQSLRHFLLHRTNTEDMVLFFFFLVKIQLPPPQAFLITRHYIKPEEQLASVLKGDLEEKYRKSENPDLFLLCFARGWDKSSNNCSRQLMNQSWRWLQ